MKEFIYYSLTLICFFADLNAVCKSKDASFNVNEYDTRPGIIPVTPLQKAIENGDENAINMLLETLKVDVNKTNAHGDTALHTLFRRIKYPSLYHASVDAAGLIYKTVNRLLAADCDPNIKDQSGMTPLMDWISALSRTKLPLRSESLIHNFVEYTTKSVRSLIKSNGFDPTVTDSQGRTYLIQLLQLVKRPRPPASVLPHRGFPGSKPISKDSPLALRRVVYEVAELLLSAGVPVDAVDNKGCSALYYAEKGNDRSNNDELLELLKKYETSK